MEDIDLLTDIAQSDRAWEPVLLAIEAGDVFALKAAALDFGTGKVRLDLVVHAQYGVPGDLSEDLLDDARAAYQALAHDRVSVMHFCFLNAQATAARALLDLPLPGPLEAEGRKGWFRRLTHYRHQDGGLREDLLIPNALRLDDEAPYPFVQLLLELAPDNPQWAEAEKDHPDVAARIQYARMYQQIGFVDGRPAEPVTPYLRAARSIR